jgi:pantoate kinase
VKKTASAFAPSAISSFFEICDTTTNGKPIDDLTKVGARGGGFGLQKGVLTHVSISEAKTNNIQVFINGKPAPNAKTTQTVIQALLGKATQAHEVIVEHKIDLPMSMGFGTSAGGALTAGLALKEALELPLTRNQIGRIAHVAEIQCQTGLGTVGALSQQGGCVLVVEPGAPGTCIIDSIPMRPDFVVVAGLFSSTPKKEVFSSPKKRQEINCWGKLTLQRILEEPSIDNFLCRCQEFAQKTGFVTENTRKLMKLAEQAGAIGAAQNMVGEAVHALTLEKNAENVAEAFKQVLPEDKVIIASIDFEGARLIGI